VEPHHKKQVSTIRVLVADNSKFHTQLLVKVLSRNPDLQIVSSNLDSASLIAASSTEKIDVFVLSAFVDEGSQRGFEILEELRETNPHARAVLLLDSSKPEAVIEAFRAGARGVFDHRDSSDLLGQCIRKVHQGQLWLNNEQIAVVLDALASAPKVRAVNGNGMNLLSKREADVVVCVAEGLTNREIGARLGLSQHTVKNHMFRIFDKLGVSSRVELLFMTLSQGTAAPPLLEGLLKDPAGDFDDATLALCEKAAEHGILAAQLMLARISWSRRSSDSDVIRSYMWYCVAFDQLTRAKNNVKKAMNPAQLAEADLAVRERLNNSHPIAPSLPSQASSRHESSVVA
jgi:two-component system nitrate/nitrite response regulator NarL